MIESILHNDRKWEVPTGRLIRFDSKEDLEYFSKTNYEEYRNLMGKRETLWKRYNRAKSEEIKYSHSQEVERQEVSHREYLDKARARFLEEKAKYEA